ncbi:MAG: MFS transporter [Bacteroidetes bacterium]|nr:MFS transporter [Bacteroidota bacterium]
MNNTARILVIWLTVFIDLIGFGIIIPVLPDLAVNLGGSEQSIAVAALYPLMNFFFAPFWGRLSDRYGRRPIILISVLITAISQFWFAFITAFWMLAIQRSIAGIGSANISAANAYMADISTKENRAKNMGLIGAAFGLGFIFGPLIGGFVMHKYGIFGVGMVSGGFSVLNLILAFIFLGESLKEKNKEVSGGFNPIVPLIKAMKNRAVGSLFFINLLFIAAFALMQVTVALLWEEHFDLNKKEVGMMFGFLGLTTAIVQSGLVGRLNKRMGEKRLLKMGLAIMGISLATLPLTSSIYLELLIISGISFAYGCISPSVLSLLSGQVSAREQGNVMGLNQSMGSLGRVLGPILGGVLYAWDFRAPYLGSGLILLFALWFTFDILRKNIIKE